MFKNQNLKLLCAALILTGCTTSPAPSSTTPIPKTLPAVASPPPLPPAPTLMFIPFVTEPATNAPAPAQPLTLTLSILMTVVPCATGHNVFLLSSTDLVTWTPYLQFDYPANGTNFQLRTNFTGQRMFFRAGSN